MIRAIRLLAALVACLLSVAVHAETPEAGQRQEQVIEPALDRRDIKVPRIDTENFEVSLFGGVLSVEDFGSHPVYGGRFAYHLSEDLFVEATVGASTVTDESFRNFALTIFEEQDQDLLYYNVSVGYNLFPGEIFIWRDHAFTSSIYLIGGVGNTNFDDEDFFTVNFGFGAKVLPMDFLSVRFDVRDHIFSSDLLGESKTTNNIEITGTIGFFF